MAYNKKTKTNSKKSALKSVKGKDGMGMRQTYKQTGEVEGIKSSITSGLPRSNKNAMGGI